MLQSFKKSLKKSLLPPKAALQEFLMQYRRTPLPSGLSPSELLNGRQTRRKIDVPKPSVSHTMLHKESKKVNGSEQTLNSFKFRVGDPCYAKVFISKSEKSPKWVPAVITKVLGTRSCNVKVCPSGATWRRHIEQLHPLFRCNDNAEPGELPEESSCGSFTTQPAEDVAVTPTIIAATGSNRGLPAVPTRRSQR